MRGALAKHRSFARVTWLRGSTALAACLLAGAIPLAMSAVAQDFEYTQGSPDADLLLEADTVIYDNDRNTVTAVGGVRIDYDGNRLVAQRVTYDRASGRMIASGNVEIVDRDGNRLYSNEIDVTDDFRDAFVRMLRVETADKTYFAADSAERRDGEVTTFNYGVYTACEPCEEDPDKPPVWRVKAEKIIWNGKAKTVRFENSRFEFFGMPLAFLPAFEIADPTVRRKTGFLLPTYRASDELGHGVRVPFYIALAPTYDITLKPAWYSRQGFVGEAEWRQRFNSGEYSITVAGMKQQAPGAFGAATTDNRLWRGMVGTKGKFQINPRWSFGWDVLVQTDKNFSHRYGIEGYGDIRRTNEVYLTGLNDRNFFDLRFQKFQVQEPYLDSSPSARDGRQPWVLPSFDYAFTPSQSIAGGELNIDVNVQSIRRRVADWNQFPIGATTQTSIPGLDGNSTRLTAEAEWKRSFITSGGLVLTPLLHARGDAIGVNLGGGSGAAITSYLGDNPGVAADIRASYYRAMATAGLEVRWPVLFSTASSTHVLEPMGQLFIRPNEPFGTTIGIPNEDAQSLVFDAASLFERDKFSGYDRIEGGTRANFGLRYSGNFANGWSAQGLFGQSFHLAGVNPYASPDLVHAGAFSGLETSRSDYVGSLGLQSPTGISLAAGARFDERSFAVRRTDISAGYSSMPVTASVAYSYIEAQPDYGYTADRHEVRGSASVRVAENWRVFGNGTYNFTAGVMTHKGIGFAYDDECFSYELAGSEYINPQTSERTRTVGFRIALRTLGDYGTDFTLDN